MIRNESDHEQTDQRQKRFVELLTPYHAQLSRFVHALMQDDESARDLLAETILRAYENFDSLRSEDAFASFIFTIARRQYYRTLRRAKWRGVFDRAVAEQIPDHSLNAPDASADHSLLDEALNKLPHKQREAVILFEISGLSLEEIREIQGGSLSGVKSRVVRGREHLSRLLNERKPAPIARTSKQAKGGSMQRVGIALVREEIR
jgi:RNA polymerase sigma-70 factor (ECF subfamily)